MQGGPDPEPVQRRVRELVPVVRSRADAAEQARRVPTETIAELTDAGLFRALVPRRFGGDERAPSEVAGAIIELAQGCSSTAWVASLLATHAFIAAWFDPRAQEELWSAGPDVRIASSVAPVGTVQRDPGGFRLSGTWSFVSGVDHARWLLLGATTSVYTLFLVPADAFTIEDDWDVSGLRATGSKSIVVREHVVPHHRALPLGAPGPHAGQTFHAGSPLYRLPWDPMFRAAFPPVAIGTALAALDAFRGYISSRVSAFTGKPWKLAAGPCLRLAEAAARVDAAAALYRRDCAELDGAASRDGALSADSAARIAYDCAFAIDACSAAIAQLWRGSGGKALHRAHPMQRHFRDVFAMTQHGAFDMDVCAESYGKELLLNGRAFGARS